MPILRRETDVFPQSVFELSQTDLRWWVAQVQSRQEKALARHLKPLGVPFYLPLWEKRSRRGGRVFLSYLPLFPGYVFCRSLATARLGARRTNLITRILDVADQGLLAEELAQLRALQESGASLFPCSEFVPGDPVRIVEGPFKGYHGVVLRGQGRPRLLVSISMLRKAVAVEFEREMLVPASPGLAAMSPRAVA
jgi:transcription antitermination factor NusG